MEATDVRRSSPLPQRVQHPLQLGTRAAPCIRTTAPLDQLFAVQKEVVTAEELVDRWAGPCRSCPFDSKRRPLYACSPPPLPFCCTLTQRR